MDKFWDYFGYVCFAGLILGQLFIGEKFVIGEICYIATDLLIIARDFALKRPWSDKVKNLGLTVLAAISLFRAI